MVSSPEKTQPTPEAKSDAKPEGRPPYETPRIQVMSEREILNTFQLTQSMASWWATLEC